MIECREKGKNIYKMLQGLIMHKENRGYGALNSRKQVFSRRRGTGYI